MGSCPWGVGWGMQHGKKKSYMSVHHPSREYLRGFLEYTPKNHSKLRMKIKPILKKAPELRPHLPPCNFIIGKKITPRDIFSRSCLHIKNFFGPCIIHMLVITVDPPCEPPTFCFDFAVHQREANPAEGTKGVWTPFWGGSYSDNKAGSK